LRSELRSGKAIPAKVDAGFASGIAIRKSNSSKSGYRFCVRNCDQEKIQFQQKWMPVLHPELRSGKSPIPAKVGTGFASGIALWKSPIPAKVATGFAFGIALAHQVHPPSSPPNTVAIPAFALYRWL